MDFKCWKQKLILNLLQDDEIIKRFYKYSNFLTLFVILPSADQKQATSTALLLACITLSSVHKLGFIGHSNRCAMVYSWPHLQFLLESLRYPHFDMLSFNLLMPTLILLKALHGCYSNWLPSGRCSASFIPQLVSAIWSLTWLFFC